MLGPLRLDILFNSGKGFTFLVISSSLLIGEWHVEYFWSSPFMSGGKISFAWFLFESQRPVHSIF